MRQHDEAKTPPVNGLEFDQGKSYYLRVNEHQQGTTSTVFINEQLIFETEVPSNVNEIILKSFLPPDHSKLSIEETVLKVGEHQSIKKHFAKLFQRTSMNHFTLLFCPEYEESFKYYLHKIAIRRIRYAMAIGFTFALAKYAYEAIFNIYSGKNKEIILLMQFGLTLPAILCTLLVTLYEPLNKYCEFYTSLVFIVTTCTLTAEKILKESQGPVLPLFILFVPFFGLTRLRFSTSFPMAMVMFLIYMMCSISAQIDPWQNVIYQGFNYLGGIFGGAVSHYRQEVLRRRNYVLYLPFFERLNPKSIYSEIKKPSYRKKTLLNRHYLNFKNQNVENVFYRFWYLIDSCPFEHPNAGALHCNVYKTVRFAVGSVIFSQTVLAFQDIQYLYNSPKLGNWVFNLALFLRFGVVIPSYIFSVVCLFCFGNNYYKYWKSEANNESRGGNITACSPLRPTYYCKPDTTGASSITDYRPSISNFDPKSPLTSYNDSFCEKVYQLVVKPFKLNSDEVFFNYVKVMQTISLVIVVFHGICMGLILLSLGVNVEESRVAAPCYYLGLLNAILFPHRSGFRVRYIYATLGTLIVCLIFTILTIFMAPNLLHEYVAYIVVSFLLGMMISYEEETLRRIFFVRRAIRTVEFSKWHSAIQTIKPWLRNKIPVMLAQKRKGNRGKEIAIDSGTPISSTMGTASKYGMYVEATKAVVAAAVEIA